MYNEIIVPNIPAPCIPSLQREFCVTYSLIDRGDPALPSGQHVVAAERFVKSALDALSAHIAILNEDGIIIHVNNAWRQFADENGFPSENYGVGDNYLVVCDRAAASSLEAAQVGKGIRSVRSRRTEEFHMEYPCHSDQERRWFVVRITRFSWYGRQRLIVAHQNVTEMRRTQNELADSKRWLEAILDSLVDGIITFNPQGCIESGNRAAGVIFGYEQHELEGLHVRDLLADFDQESTDADLDTLLRRTSGLGDDLFGRRKDNTTFPMYFAASRVTMDGRSVYTAIIQDFTERKFLEEQLWDKELINIELEKERELREIKNRFISMFSHDLKTPLASIRLASSMLRNYGDRSTPEEKIESYDTIDQQVEYLTELINDVITISRADFTGAELNTEPVDLETYLRNILEELQHTYNRRRLLIYKGIERRIEAQIDRKLMRRALINLLTNALKYSPDDTSVTLELQFADRLAWIRVIDQGIGIPEEDQPRLFEPFNRASNVGGIPGTGLGLAITRQAVDLHHGSIRVESQLGKGTTFTILLPALEA